VNPIHPRVRARRVAGRAAFFLAVSILASCDRDERAVAPEASPSRTTAAIIADPDVDTWNAFDADVNVAFSGNSALANITNASSGVGYHVHRRLLTDGTWLSDFDHYAYLPVGGASATLDPAPITRAVGAGPCRTPTFYDATGAPVTLPSPTLDAPVPNSSAVVAPPPIGTRPSVPSGTCSSWTNMRAGTNAGAARADSTTRDWIVRYIVTPSNARRLRAQFVAEMGQPKRERGRSHFSKHGQVQSLDAFIDDSTGALDEIRLSDDNGANTTLRRTYERQANGFLLLLREHVTTAAAESGIVEMDVSYRNIRISREN
jgi:hypothetical protein